MAEVPANHRRRNLALAVGGVLVLGAVLGRRSLSGRAAGGEGGCEGADYRPVPEAGEAPTGKVQQKNVALQLLQGIKGIVDLVSMINMQVKYGRQLSVADVYDETLRLQADISLIRTTALAAADAQLVATVAVGVRAMDAQITDFWGTLKTVPTMTKDQRSGFFNYVRESQNVSFAKLRELHTTLVGDGMVTGLIALTRSTMMSSNNVWIARENANQLGELVLHMRLLQLQGFEILSQAWASSDDFTSWENIPLRRKALLADLDLQENIFFYQEGQFKQWVIDGEAKYWGQGGRLEAKNYVFDSEVVAKEWNTVQEGFVIGVKPRVAIVDADFAGHNVAGEISMMCDRRMAGCANGESTWTDESCQTCDEILRPSALGSDTITANTQGLLTINYRCEGIAALKQVKVENANNQAFKLTCSDVDRFVGSYKATPETAAGLLKPAWITAEIRRYDDSTLIWTPGGDSQTVAGYLGPGVFIWKLKLLPDLKKLDGYECWMQDGKPICPKPAEFTVDVERDEAMTVLSLTNGRAVARFVRAPRPAPAN